MTRAQVFDLQCVAMQRMPAYLVGPCANMPDCWHLASKRRDAIGNAAGFDQLANTGRSFAPLVLAGEAEERQLAFSILPLELLGHSQVVLSGPHGAHHRLKHWKPLKPDTRMTFCLPTAHP